MTATLRPHQLAAWRAFGRYDRGGPVDRKTVLRAVSAAADAARDVALAEASKAVRNTAPDVPLPKPRLRDGHRVADSVPASFWLAGRDAALRAVTILRRR